MVAGLLALLVAFYFGYKALSEGKSAGQKRAPKISLLPTKPPPPPPPPKEEKKPEPPKEQKEVKAEQKDEAPPAPTLKMEGAAGDGPSPFGGGKVANEDLSRLDPKPPVVRDLPVPEKAQGKGLLDPFNVYATSIKGELQRALARRADLKRRRYGIEINLWVGEDGRVARFEMVGSTNDDETDAAIRGAMAALPAFSESPPPKMPQPVRLRIVAGGRA